MNCQNHPTETAVAICMSCGSGLCSSCSQTVVGGRHVCSETCGNRSLSDQQAAIELLSKSRLGYKLLPHLVFGMSILFISMGLSSIAVGHFGRADLMAIFAGLLAIFFGLHVRREVKSPV